MPSIRYFELINTRDDYNKFIASGLAWEVEPNCPSSWADHLRLLKIRNKRKSCL